MKRQCGILMPVFSLPSRFGIGCFDSQAYRFIDFLKESGQSMWQVLPFCQTGFGDSPYQSVSSFAGNPYFIDLEQLIGDGLLTYQECESVWFGSGKPMRDSRTASAEDCTTGQPHRPKSTRSFWNGKRTGSGITLSLCPLSRESRAGAGRHGRTA